MGEEPTMIIDKSDKTIVATGIQSEAFFSVKQENLSHLLGILRNQLYSDKIQAVIREYCTNAMDANIDAGVPNCPIQVSLPNSFSPIFKVRDFGKGLSEEQIYNVYISFGDSSKRNTNDQTGCLGLGSKSAFAYVDNFTLTSYHGGLKSVYSAFIDESEIGKITRLTCEPSDEPTGIEVAIAVKSGDYRQFSDKCYDVLKYFSPKPIILNDQSLQASIDTFDASPVLATDNWTIYKEIRWGYNRTNLRVLMGNVAYPINLDALGVGTQFASYIYSFRYMDIVIKAPIGAVKNNASREALDYNPKTQSWLFNALADFKEQVGAELSKQMESAKNMWEALLMYRNLSDKVGSSNILSYRGVRIDSCLVKLPNNVKARQVEKNRNNKFKWEEKIAIFPHPEARIFVDNGSVKRHELFGRIDSFGDLTENTYLLQFGSQAEVDEFFAKPLLEGCPWTDLNDAPYVKPTRKSNQVKSVYSDAYLFEPSSRWRNADYWKPCQIDIANGEGIYVVISHYTPVSSSISISGIEGLKKQLLKCGLDVPVYGVRGKTAQTLGAGWKSYETFTKDLFNDLTAKHGMENNWDYLTASIDTIIRELATDKFNDFVFPTCIQDVIDTIKYVHRLRWNDEMYLAQHLFDARTNSYESKLQPKIEQIFESYPMLRYVGWLHREHDVARVMDYINLVG
jgi:hypothetical protein